LACILDPGRAAADVTLGEKDGWEAFLTGRIQTFANFNEGNGRPVNSSTLLWNDGNGNPVEVRGGGAVNVDDVLPEYGGGRTAPIDGDQGIVREMRLRSGFTGNVLGFGIRKRLSERTEILGFSAVTVGIDSEQRRKFTIVRPDWRESFIRVTSFWGSLTAGRTLTLFSAGATEITYLYGYRYGLGYPGTVSNFSQSTAGSVGFGVMGNGFGAGMVYATPIIAGGLQLRMGAFDAVAFPNTPYLNRNRWPRPEGEITYSRNFASNGFFKLFVNGAWQRLYDFAGSSLAADVFGTGFGGRFEIGPFKIGVAGHYGKGIGVTYSLEPHQSVYNIERTDIARSGGDPAYPNCPMNPAQCPPMKMRTVDGAYVQSQLSVLKNLDLRAGAGITRVHQLPEDTVAWRDDPNLPDPTGTLSVGYITIKQQIGIGGGLTVHTSDNLHITLEYFRAMFFWYQPTPAPMGRAAPSQAFHFVNAGITYDF
jgi:hypothetical protein